MSWILRNNPQRLGRMAVSWHFGDREEDSMRDLSLTVRPASGGVGADVLGVDLSRPLLSEARDAIRRALADRGVVFFRDQALSPAQHIALARQFGDINVN